MKKRNFKYVLDLEVKDKESWEDFKRYETFFGKQDRAMAWFRKILKNYKDIAPKTPEIRVKFCGYVYE